MHRRLAGKTALLMLGVGIIIWVFSIQAVAQPINFRAHLSGDQEVPAVETSARGQALFQVSPDGAALEYKVIVANIEDVTQAHLHMGPQGQNGPVVAFLYGFEPPGSGRTNGVLTTGTITSADLIGPLAGQDLSVLIQSMMTGGIYVNVHTAAHPPGEIRGQIR